MLSVPILFLVFNRPDTTFQVLQSIRSQRPKRIYISSDGPRVQKPGEAALVYDLRKKILAAIDWECEVFTLYQEINMGCGKAVSTAINWFFEQEEAGIIIEDDISPDASFYPFCEALLTKYKDDTTVMHITGQNFQFEKDRTQASYYFSRYPLIWGWATWRRAWEKYNFMLEDFHHEKVESLPAPLKQALLDVKANNVDTWDYQWIYAIWKHNGKCIVPNVNLIYNIGFGGSATHTTEVPDWYKKLQRGQVMKLVHPTSTMVCEAADEYYVKHIVNDEPFPFSVRKLRQLYYRYKKRLNGFG
jgi:hypothetical protein